MMSQREIERELREQRERNYEQISGINYSMMDSHGQLLSDDNDPLLDRLVKFHWFDAATR